MTGSPEPPVRVDAQAHALKRRMNERLRQLRWTLADVAAKTGENYRNVHRWLREDVKVPADFVARFVRVVPVSADWLLTGEGTLEPIPPSNAEMALEQIAQIIDRIRPGSSGRSFLESLVNSSMDGILAFDTDDRFTVWNSAMERISGVAASAVLGRRTFDVFPFLLETGADEAHRAVLRGEAVRTGDRPFSIPETGREGWYEANYASLRNGWGDIVGGLCIVRDVTERRRAEQSLRESEERYRRLVEHSPNGVAVHADDRLLYVNPAGAAIFGAASPAEMVGKSILDLVAAEQRANVPGRIRRVMESGGPVGPVLQHVVRLDGHPIMIELTAVQITYKGRPASQVVFHLVPVRRRRRRRLGRPLLHHAGR